MNRHARLGSDLSAPRSAGRTAELGAADALAEGEAVAARDLDHEVAQAPGVVGQRRDHGGAAALAVAIQVLDAGHADIGGGRLVHAGAGRADEREADRVAAEQDQAHGLLLHLDGEAEHITQERGGGPQVGHLQIGSATQPVAHGCMLRAPAAPGSSRYLDTPQPVRDREACQVIDGE